MKPIFKKIKFKNYSKNRNIYMYKYIRCCFENIS